MQRYVIYYWAHPHQILPADWTKEQAEAMCDELNEPFRGQMPGLDNRYWVQKVTESSELRRYPDEPN